MASLRNIIREYRKNITDGIAWVVIYKDGRSWKGNVFWPDGGDYEDGFTFVKGDLEQMVEIAKAYPKAICINGNFMGFSEDFTQAEIEDKVRLFYKARRHQLFGDFMDCLVCNLDEVETPDTDDLAGTYIDEYEGTLVTVKDVEVFDTTGRGKQDYYNPSVTELSDGTYWFWQVNGSGYDRILESLSGETLVYDDYDGYCVKTQRGTRRIKWAD